MTSYTKCQCEQLHCHGNPPNLKMGGDWKPCENVGVKVVKTVHGDYHMCQGCAAKLPAEYLHDREYELKLASGKTVVWAGKNGLDASMRYVDSNPAEKVMAWRDYPRHGIFPGVSPGQIIGEGKPWHTYAVFIDRKWGMTTNKRLAQRTVDAYGRGEIRSVPHGSLRGDPYGVDAPTFHVLSDPVPYTPKPRKPTLPLQDVFREGKCPTCGGTGLTPRLNPCPDCDAPRSRANPQLHQICGCGHSLSPGAIAKNLRECPTCEAKWKLLGGRRFAWVITHDYITPTLNSLGGEKEKSEVGTCGPNTISKELAADFKAGKYHPELLTESFKMYDDDRVLYYEGRCTPSPSGRSDESLFIPLDEFGTPNAGAVSIHFRNHKSGKYEML